MSLELTNVINSKFLCKKIVIHNEIYGKGNTLLCTPNKDAACNKTVSMVIKSSLYHGLFVNSTILSTKDMPLLQTQ